MKDPDKMTGEEVVITGMSGVFPDSDCVLEFMDNLYNKVDMVSDEPRWTTKDPEIPNYNGKISGIEKFDAQFFKISYQQAMVMEPMSRKILEHAYGAIFDSGNTPATLKGKRVGVFIGSSVADFSSLVFYDIRRNNNSVVGGNSKSMLANRISYWMDGKGPSFNVDCSCASSSAALEEAYKSIKFGECDAALVGGCGLCSHPILSLNMQRYGLLCMDGKTKCFDKNGDGYVRSEAISLIFLQKAKDAKRIYAELYHTKGAFKLGSKFTPTRNSKDIQEFIKDIYLETDTDPSQIEYVEANAAAIAEADLNEIDAVSNIFSKNKSIKIGSVKSNAGNTEAASGLCALTKLCLAYHQGVLPANLHYNNPLDHPSIKEGKIQVLTETTKFNRGYTALNNFSITGANFHTILKGHYKEKDHKKYKTNIPYLVLASGRNESSVKKIFNELKKKPTDPEEIGLLHDIFGNDIVGHTERGYTLLHTKETKETESVCEKTDYYPGLRRPLWFIYSGMGSQWATMGADLMRIPIFASAIEKCHKVLEPKGLDLIKILTEPDNKIFENVLNSFVAITAVQIGLTDILKKIDIVPDYIIGHSLGEMGCAYHDNTLTAEELILATYSRGLAVIESNLKPGLMAAVGIGYQQLKNICPPDIDIACHNSSESSTISGPIESIKKFIGELTKQGIFAREVPSANVAYHSRYVADSGPKLLTLLKSILKNPKLRSEKWISTSIPKENWDSVTAKYSSAEYHTNNLLNPVLFEEMAKMIPDNAVVVEIAPHGLLQSIVKRSHPECTYIPLTRRGYNEGTRFLLDAIGKLYIAGYNPKIGALYPKIEYPVSTETPMLSHLVEWEHSEDWLVLENKTPVKVMSSSRDFVISVYDDDYAYLQDYFINGVNLLPESAILVFVWETLAMYKGMAYQDMSVIFRDIQFYADITIVRDMSTRFTVMISKGNEKFEVNQDDKLIASGTVISAIDSHFRYKIENDDVTVDFDRNDINLNADDVYRIFNNRGYFYGSNFQTIYSTNLNMDRASIKWSNEWVLFIDGLVQFNNISRNSNGISKPKLIKKITINVSEHEKIYKNTENKVVYHKAQVYKAYGVTRCAGVEIEDITFIDQPINEKETNLIKTGSFYPFNNMNNINMKTAMEVNFEIIKENMVKKDINVINICGSEFYEVEVFNEATNKNIKEPKSDFVNNVFKSQDNEKTNVIIIENLLQDQMKTKILQSLITNDSYVITIETEVPKHSIKDYFSIITSMSDGKNIIIMIKKTALKLIEDVCYITIPIDRTFSWVPKILGEIETAKRVVLVSERQPYCGLFGFVSKLKTNGYNIGLIVIDDFHAPKFDPDNSLYREQISKKLTINILKKGQWGGFYYTSADKSANAKNIILKSFVAGDLDKLTWIETPKTSAQKNLIQVCYSGISLQDYEKTLNDTDELNLGMEYSGIDKSGEKIMGLVRGGSLASTIEADDDLIWPVPDTWTLEDAATVLLPYIGAYYALLIRADIAKNHTVFVNGGTESFKHAVISICLGLKIPVFTTVKDEKRKQVLLQLCPQLNENHIGYSNDVTMLQTVMDLTHKEGCNIVINCNSGNSREDAMKYVSKYGIYLDLSTEDIKQNKCIGMAFLQGDRSYKAVDVCNIFRTENKNERKRLQLLITEGISKGIVKPLPRIVFTSNDITRAFRCVALPHCGRVLVRMKDPNVNSKDLNIVPRLEYSPDDVIVIISDENGVATELAERLIKRGVRRLVMHTKAEVSGYIHTKIVSWEKQGVTLKLCSENLETGCETFTKNAMKFGKVKGIFVVFDTKYTENNINDFVNTFNNKCSVVMNLELSSRNCMDLSHFVILTPLPKSLNDDYALSFIDTICEKRNEMGFYTMVFRYQSLDESDGTKSKCDKTPTSLSELFNSLEASLKLKHKNILSCEMKEIRGDFHEKVYKILGIKDPKTFNTETLIENLNLNDTVLNGLRSVIYDNLQIDCPVPNLLRMSVQSILNLNKKEKIYKYGLSIFINKIDTEEDYLASESIVEMKTLQNGFNLENTSDCVLMVPGFEGLPDIFTLVSERLKIRAFCVQLGPHLNKDSIYDIAIEVRKIMKTKFQINHNFYLLGYSFGVNICLELARILEKEGYSGTIYCLDSSPEALKTQLDTHIGPSSPIEIQNKVLYHIFSTMTGKKDENLKTKLQDAEIFSEKLETCLNAMKGVVKYSKDYKRSVLDMACKRILMAKDYEPQFQLNSQLVLMKSLENLNLPKDYGLSKLTNKKVEVFDLISDHASAPNDCRVSNIINKFLDPKILEDFKKNSCCNVYYAN